jgi:molecular chaperone HscB
MTGFTEFFSLLSILPAYDLDPKALEAQYFSAQRRLHPDRFIGKPDAERLAALQQSATINQAYDTLKDPLKRAQYLLLLQGIFVGTEKDTIKPSQELLVEMMELRESIDEAASPTALFTLADEIEESRLRLERLISVAYAKEQWDKMAQLTLQLGYVQKALDDVRVKKLKITAP